MPCHKFGDRGLTNVDAELEEFSMDPGAPTAGWRRSWRGSIAGFYKSRGENRYAHNQHCTYPANAIEADVTGYLVVKPKKIAHGVYSSPPFHFGHAAAKASVAVKTPRLRRFAAP
jgi:hypothetical protein